MYGRVLCAAFLSFCVSFMKKPKKQFFLKILKMWILLFLILLKGWCVTAEIDTVYILFSNHLDVGYTDKINGSSSGGTSTSLA